MVRPGTTPVGRDSRATREARGNLTVEAAADGVADRLLTRLVPDTATGCLVWQGARRGRGYGSISIGGLLWQAHRVAYELAIGKIPDGLVLDHRCNNKLCCNPAHLVPVTQRENILRGTGTSARNAAKTHCPAGHELNPENAHTSADGKRRCRICDRRRRRGYRAAQRAAKHLERP